MLRPYTEVVAGIVDSEDPVHVVGHDDEFVQADVREMHRNPEPTIRRRSASNVQTHLTLADVSKHVVADSDADGDEVDALA